MTMAALPGMYITWDESAESLDSFLRYQLYRREQGESDWLKLARITDRGITFYNDYTVASGTLYEYAVTQVKDVAGEEVESEFPTASQVSLTIRSLFVHDVASPAHYAEVLAQAQTKTPEQDITYLQPWSARAPVAHVGARRQDVIEADYTASWADSLAVWEALADLQARQRDNGAVLMVRQYRGIRVFAALDGSSRSDNGVLYTTRLRFREVEHSEEVA